MMVLSRLKTIDQTERGLEPHNWRRRQYKSDNSTPRVQKHRSAERNVSETPPEYRVQNTDKERRSLRSRPSKRASAVSIPDDWKPDREFSSSHGLSEQRIDEEVARFRDHALAKGRTAKNWDAAWRNWVTSPFQKTTSQNGQAPRPGSKEDNRERTAQMLRDLDAYINAHPDDEEPSREDRQKNAGLLPFRKPA
jgi:hypothetical protein